MLLEDHKRRVGRLLRGERRVTDLDRLFADLRLMKPGRESVREIGHFAAHRSERTRGMTFQRVNDIQTSARLWHLHRETRSADIDHLKQAGQANFNIIPDKMVRQKFSISRETARQSFNKGIRKLESGLPLKAREQAIVAAFGLSMMWQFAFDDRGLFDDLIGLLLEEGSMKQSEAECFEPVFSFTGLYALAIMHGARLRLPDGEISLLRLDTSDAGNLRITAEIPILRSPKPVLVGVTLFESSLCAQTYCDSEILTMFDEPQPVEVVGSRIVGLS